MAASHSEDRDCERCTQQTPERPLRRGSARFSTNADIKGGLEGYSVHIVLIITWCGAPIHRKRGTLPILSKAIPNKRENFGRYWPIGERQV